VYQSLPIENPDDHSLSQTLGTLLPVDSQPEIASGLAPAKFPFRLQLTEKQSPPSKLFSRKHIRAKRHEV